MDGVLVIDKPAGPTSHDVVSAVRKLLRIKKVGHTGTLDPAATGVLPLVLGKATKVARYLTSSDKVYVATVRLGANTDTLDSEGKVVQERPVTATEQQVREVVTAFEGETEQMPPMYSAKKIDGKRLYELARKGVEVERTAKKVTIRRITLLKCALPDVTIEVQCSAGTYLRVLAEDIGNRLGCGGYLLALRRTQAGPFGLQNAVTLDQVADTPDAVRAAVVPLAEALQEMPRINVPASVGRMIVSGHQLRVADLRALDVPNLDNDQAVTLVQDGGLLVAIARSLIKSSELPMLRRERRALKTERVFLRN